ncbi:MAG: glycosyltransferase [Candidatus Binatia bacterium]
MSRRIMISGSIGACGPGYGGHCWAVLQYLLGFARLGFETFYVEQLARNRWRDRDDAPAPMAESVNAVYFRAVMERFGLTERSALLDPEGPDHVGLSHVDVERIAQDVELLVNRSGHLQLAGIMSRLRRRLYLDVDPGYTQVWQERYGVDMNLRGHDVYVTVGLNLGEPECPFPTCGIRWEKTLPPVVLADWANEAPAGSSCSTIADWRGFGAIEWQGRWYGQKADVFRRFLGLPKATAVPLELCLLVHPEEDDRVELEANGWRLASPRDCVETPDAYRAYVQASLAEFSVAKEAYAAGNTGWWSDRSSCYLAAGRPVVVHDTGFGRLLPTGQGILPFRDLEGAVEALGRLGAEYERHAIAAREIAREHLDSDRVLARLCELAGV